jgi:PKD repeat protein
MNELHYWTVNGPGIPNPTQNTEIPTYYVTPGATYNICQQLMITSSGCNTTECQDITIPDTIVPVCDAAFTYYYQPTNAYLNVSSPYAYGQGSFEHNWLVTSYMSDGTVNANNQLNVNNNSLFVAANTSALEICHTLTNLNTGCVDSSCQYLDFCTAEYTHVIDTANQVLTLTAGGIQTLASHSWNVTYHAIGGVYDSEILNGPIATFFLPEGILDMTICHVVNNTFPGSTCSTYACDTIVFCNAEFTVIDNGNGTAGIWAVSPPTPGAVYTWSITGPGYNGAAYSGSYFNFTPVPNEPYYVCMAYFNGETGCSASNCDTIVVEGNSNTCQALFNYYIDPTVAGQVIFQSTSSSSDSIASYNWTLDGISISNSPVFNFIFPSNNGGMVCLTITSSLGCSDTYCQYVTPGNNATCLPYFNYQASANNALDYTFTNTTTTTGTNATYYWYFGDGANSSEASPTHVYNQAGTYSVCLQVITDQCQNTMCQNITVVNDTTAGNGCIANFTYVADSTTIQFSNNSYTPSQPVTFIWQFSDGTYSNEVSPIHTFDTTGVYQVCLDMTNGSCSDSYCLQVYVGVPDSNITCNASFQYSYVGDAPNPSMFPYQFYSAYSGDIAEVIHSWTTSDGQAAANYSPLFGFAPGTYTVCHTVSDVNGLCSDSTCISITVVPDTLNGCTAMFTSYISNTATNEVTFVNMSSDLNASFIWQFGDGSPSEFGVNAIHTYAAPGSYPVNLNMTGNGCYDDYTFFVTILPNLPSDGCSASFDYTCQVANPLEVLFDAGLSVTAGNNPSFSWDFGDGSTATGLTVYHTYNIDGLYSVCLTAYSDSCSSTSCGGVYVGFSDTTATCNASFTMDGPMQPDSYLFTGVNNNSNAYHLWTFGDGTSSTLAMPYHSYADPGTYEVCHITGVDGVCADTVCNSFYIGLYIAGVVNLGANCIDYGSVKLFSLDTISNSVELIGQYSMDNNLCSYIFTGLPIGVYLVSAGLSDSSAFYNQYVPTYYGNQYYWNDAQPIYLTESGSFYNIYMIYGSNPGGNGYVGGSIDDGPFRLSNPELSSSMSPVLGAQVVITDLANVPQRWVRTDNSGAFSITDLAYGTYRLMADEPGMTCLPIEFTLSEQTPGVTIDLVMGDEITGIVSYETSFVQGDVYPNPSNSLANLNIELIKPASLTMTMTSITGQVTWTKTNSFLQGKSSIQIPVRGIADGLYFLSIYSYKGQLITTRKMQVAN